MSTCCSERSRESALALIVSNHRYPAHSYVITTRIAHCEQVVLNPLAQHHPVQRISSSAFMIEGVHVTTRPLVLMTLTLRATRNIAWTGNILHLKLILSSIADVFGSIDYDLFCSGQATPLIWPLLCGCSEDMRASGCNLSAPVCVPGEIRNHRMSLLMQKDITHSDTGSFSVWHVPSECCFPADGARSSIVIDQLMLSSTDTCQLNTCHLIQSRGYKRTL